MTYKRVFCCKTEPECDIDNSNLGDLDQCDGCSSQKLCQKKMTEKYGKPNYNYGYSPEDNSDLF